MTLDERLAGMAPDQEVEIITDPNEVAFLRAWRAADDEGKRDAEKLLRAGVAGLLPTVEEIKAMTKAERRAFIDSLPAKS